MMCFYCIGWPLPPPPHRTFFLVYNDLFQWVCGFSCCNCVILFWWAPLPVHE
uniref:Uncharacterized protein n=1 Tax=Populus trichocarpa TaxID=3694 RepID=A9PI06_POPTR|nr:unknown [Populus trichocarpa]